MLRVARIFLFFVFAAAATIRVSAQSTEVEAPAEYRVNKLTVRFNGTANVNEQVVRANMAVREGSDMDDAMIDRDIRSLYRTGLFEFIEIKREVLANHGVNLVVEVTPKYRVLTVKFEGNKEVKSHRLLKETKSKANSPLDERQVKEDSEKLREFYQKKGYNQATVTYSIERDRSTGFGTVVFKVHEGERVKISEIRFVGNAHVKKKKLLGEMDTKKYGWFSWLLDTGRLKDDQFEDDLEKLRDYYRNEGYLDVDIAPEKVIYDYPKPGKLVITIQVSEGREYHIGDISITGNKLHPTALLRFLLQQQPGMVFSPEKLDKDVETLEDFYGKDGYLETRARLIRKPNLKTGNIDVEYHIEESEQFFVESIEIEGNEKTKSVVILRELTLGPGEVFNMVRMKLSKLRLENTRFFDEGSVSLSPENTNIPNRKNLKVSVKEGRTGNVTFGLGFSTLEKGVIFAELTQSNFDLFNTRSFFQGSGQKFRIRIQFGQESSDAILSFEEPWLFDRALTLGFSIFRTQSDLENQLYNQISTGASIYVRKRLFELVEGKLTYEFQHVKIDEVDPSLALVGVVPEDWNISTVSFQLLRETRDKLVNTTSGSHLELNTDVSGGPFGGNLSFYRLEFRGSQFFPLFKAQAQSLAVIARLGTINNYGSTTSLPYFENFFLGGPYTLRGFENQDVGPRNSAGTPLGGKSYGLFTLEYSLDVVSPVRFAVFYDAGFVNVDAYDFTPSDYNDDFGVGIRLFIAGAPLSLDYGIPLTSDHYNRKGNQFNFSFGTRF